MECSARAGENADSIFKIIDSQKKPMYLPEKGEAESRKKHQKMVLSLPPEMLGFVMETESGTN